MIVFLVDLEKSKDEFKKILSDVKEIFDISKQNQNG